MRELLQGYLSELNWAGGATKDDLMAHLAGRDDALRTMVNQYVAEGTYQAPGEVINVIPAEAWQGVQGDAWRGAESQYAEDVPSNFQQGPVGQAERDIYRSGGAPAQTPGFGQSAGASGNVTGGSMEARASAGGAATVGSAAMDETGASGGASGQ